VTQTRKSAAAVSPEALGAVRETRDEILDHRKTLAAALFTVYFLTEAERRPRGWRAASMDEAFEVLEQPTTGKREQARLRFLTLANLRKSEGRRGALGDHAREVRGDFLPYAVVSSSAHPVRDNETAAEVKVLMNAKELGDQTFIHIARAVDPRAWIETGFFSDMYRLDWHGKAGVPSYDAAGLPCRNLLTNAQPLGELWFGTGKPGAGRHPDASLLDLVFEGFQLQGVDGKPMSTFNNIFGIERFLWDDRELDLRFRLYRSIDSKLQGLPRGGGMDKNDGSVTARRIDADEFVKLFNREVPSVRALLALKSALGGQCELTSRVETTLAQLKLDTDIEKAAAALARDCVLVTATKQVHFTDLTSQGEPFIDLGEILNYASPMVLKPFFEQLLLLGACARPGQQLRGIVEGPMS
jgi:hypothetical protein